MKALISSSVFPSRRVTACIPHFRCKQYIRRAVESLLSQTHRDLIVVVINDGDSDPPWHELSSIRDPRLVRFHLNANRGPFFATTVALCATTAPYFLIQDADDWSAPERVSLLLNKLERERSDFAVSAQPQLAPGRNGYEVTSVRWGAVSSSKVATPFTINRYLTAEYLYRAPHHGLFRSSSLRRVGAYYAGFRYSYDTLLTNLLMMTGSVSHVARPLYFRFVRQESITHSAMTGVRSPNGRKELQAGAALYHKCFQMYSLFLAGRLSSTALAESIRKTCAERTSSWERHNLALEAQRLRTILIETNREKPSYD